MLKVVQIIYEDEGGECRIMQSILFSKNKLPSKSWNLPTGTSSQKIFMTAADSYHRQNLKLDYLPEDSLQKPNYVPLPAGRIFNCKDWLQADSIVQITRIWKAQFSGIQAS